MKKTIIAILVAFFSLSTVKAQTWSEWFNQKNTQRKYLLEQIAALRIYGGYVQKGYRIGKEGLTAIGDSKDADLKQHQLYFNSLKRVSPAVKEYAKVKQVRVIQERISNIGRQSMVELTGLEFYRQEELSYCRQVYERLKKEGKQILDQLEAVTTDGILEMKDDERLRLIDGLFATSEDQYRFVNRFSMEAILLAKSKKAQIKNIKDIRVLTGEN